MCWGRKRKSFTETEKLTIICFHRVVVFLKERIPFGKEICIQGRGISSKQNIKGYLKIPEFVLNFADSLIAKNLLKRTQKRKGKTEKIKKG